MTAIFCPPGVGPTLVRCSVVIGEAFFFEAMERSVPVLHGTIITVAMAAINSSKMVHAKKDKEYKLKEFSAQQQTCVSAFLVQEKLTYSD